MKNKLIKTSNQNVNLLDSINILNIKFDVSSSELKILKRKFSSEKELWDNQIASLHGELLIKTEQITLLTFEKDSILSEKNKFESLINSELNELSLAQIDVLQKKIKETERNLLKKDEELAEYREARKILSDKLFEANQKLTNNEALFIEMSMTLTDFFTYMRSLENKSFSLKNELDEIFPEKEKNLPIFRNIEGNTTSLSIEAESEYIGSGFLNEIHSLMKRHKLEVDILRAKQEKIRQIVESYDRELSYMNDIVGIVDSLVSIIKIQQVEILDYEELSRIRFLLVASTDELKEMGILYRNDWRRPREKRRIKLNEIDLNNFKKIDYEFDTEIKIPDSIRFRSLVTNHENWSYSFNKKTNTFHIEIKQDFWKVSNILIIETE